MEIRIKYQNQLERALARFQILKKSIGFSQNLNNLF